MGQQPAATQPQRSHRLVWIAEPVYNDLMQHFKGTGAIVPAQQPNDPGDQVAAQKMVIPSRQSGAPTAMARGGVVRRAYANGGVVSPRRQPLANTRPFQVRYPGVNPRMAQRRPMRMAQGGVINWPNVFDPNMIGPVDDQPAGGQKPTPPFTHPIGRIPGKRIATSATSPLLHVGNGVTPVQSNVTSSPLLQLIAAAANPAAAAGSNVTRATATAGGGPALTRQQMIASGLGFGNQPAPGTPPPWFQKPPGSQPPIGPPPVGPI